MDLDKITDIELLRNICKQFMIKMKKDYIEDGYTFKKDHWYFFEQNEFGVEIFSTDEEMEHVVSLSYPEAKIYCCAERTSINI